MLPGLVLFRRSGDRAAPAAPACRVDAAGGFNDLLMRYFGTVDLRAVAKARITVGLARAGADLVRESDRQHRLRLWCFLFILGRTPDLDVLEHEADRRFAQMLKALPDGCDRRAT